MDLISRSTRTPVNLFHSRIFCVLFACRLPAPVFGDGPVTTSVTVRYIVIWFFFSSPPPMRLYFHRHQLVILSVCLCVSRITQNVRHSTTQPIFTQFGGKVQHLAHGGNHYMPQYCTNLHKKSFIIQSLYCTFDFFTFVSCLLTVTLHLVDVRLTCLINITYLLTYLLSYLLTFWW